jgi:hypothetical protein
VDVIFQNFLFAPIVRVDLDLERIKVVGELALPSAAETGAHHSAPREEFEIPWHFMVLPRSETIVILDPESRLDHDNIDAASTAGIMTAAPIPTRQLRSRTVQGAYRIATADDLSSDLHAS